jgi:flagellar hook protein FlgE
MEFDPVGDPTGDLKLSVTGIDWANNSDPTQSIDIDISSLTQSASDFSVGTINQDGAELGLRTGISIDTDGNVVASFSNGLTQNLARVPIATFTNPNGLQERSGNVYIQTSQSGAYNLRQAGEAGAGKIATSSLEASNVDLADEFSRMIITQRAYSAGTKIISTTDQMLTELLGLR